MNQTLQAHGEPMGARHARPRRPLADLARHISRLLDPLRHRGKSRRRDLRLEDLRRDCALLTLIAWAYASTPIAADPGEKRRLMVGAIERVLIVGEDDLADEGCLDDEAVSCAQGSAGEATAPRTSESPDRPGFNSRTVDRRDSAVPARRRRV